MPARFFDISHDMLGVASIDGELVSVNASWTRMLGWSPARLTSGAIYDFVHPDDHDPTRDEFGKLASGRLTTAFRNRYRCSDGSYRWIDWRASLDPETGLIHAAGRDTQDLVQLNEGLRERDEQLTRLMAEQLDVRDLEVGRISSALHDSAVQNSVAALMYLELARRGALPAAAEEYLQRVEDQIRGSLDATRQVLQGLDPCETLLHDVAAAIESVAADIAEQFSIVVDVQVTLEQQPTDKVAAMLYRVVREGLVNAGKHANGSHVRVLAKQADAGIYVEVADDGSQAPVASGEHGVGLGLGLPILRERVRRMGGTLELTLGLGGSRLSAVIPAQ